MEDSRILELYWARDEQAIRETKEAYGKYCFAVACSVLGNTWDAEEVVSETWLRTWNSIPPNRPSYLKQYLAKITRNLALNTYMAQNAHKRKGDQVALALEELGTCIPSNETAEGHWEAEELKEAISKFLRTQSPRDRSVFLWRYFYLESVEHIADIESRKTESGTTEARLTMEVPAEDALCREIFFAFSRGKKAILQMNMAKVSLEDIFIRLVGEQRKGRNAKGGKN